MSNPQQRRDRQAEQLDVILNLPAKAQPGALYALWPHRLPKIAKEILSSELRQQWRELRILARARREALAQERLTMATCLEPKNRLLLMQLGYTPDLMLSHEEKAQRLLDMATGLRHEKILSVGLVQDPENEYNFHFPANWTHGKDGKEHVLLRVLCVALEHGGVFLIHQKLGLKTLFSGPQGDEWKCRELVRAACCNNGNWRALSPKELRDLHSCTAADEDKIPDVLTFGTLEDLMR